MEETYQERWDIHMMADYCLNLQRHRPLASHTRKCNNRRFASID